MAEAGGSRQVFYSKKKKERISIFVKRGETKRQAIARYRKNSYDI